jgi:hypothetical protein
MRSRLEPSYLTILAALGLELACGRREPEIDPTKCDNPSPIMQAGTEIPSGFVECEDGFIHRTEAVECEAPAQVDDPECAGQSGVCQTSADCADQPHGSCQINDFDGECGCTYGCATDADCAPGELCKCAGVGGGVAECVPSDCTTTSDCSEGLCALSRRRGVCGDSWVVACTTPNDECRSDDHCSPAPCPGGNGSDTQWYCQGEPNSGWMCQASPGCDGSICGRPLLIDGDARIAAVCERADWCASVELDLTPSAIDTRERLAAHWLEVGRFEHASVASFARFAGHLLQLGAPARLLRETSRAMMDEVEHAQLAFGLASAYAGRDLGPGPLEVHGAVEADLDRSAIVEALIVEACVGGTLAALEAREAAAWARDPAIAAVLERIADDELRHAALGWRALRWMLDDGDDDLRRFARARLDAALADVRLASVHGGITAKMRVHGLLDDALREQLRRRVLVELFEPCAAALVAREVTA